MNSTLLSLALLYTVAPPVQKASDPDTLLYVRTTPSGAEVRLNGQPVGTSDGLFAVKPGTYTIVVDLTDHQPEQQRITIRDGRITRIELELQQKHGHGVVEDETVRAGPGARPFHLGLHSAVSPAGSWRFFSPGRHPASGRPSTARRRAA